MTLSDAQKGLITFTIVLVIGWLLGLGTGWKLWQTPPPVVHVTPKPQVNNPDGSVVLAVQPSQDMHPAHPVPPGSHVESVASVTVQPLPKPPGVSPVAPGALPGSPLANPCPPVTVDITVYRDPDGSRRIEVSSPDGKILKGIHIENEMGPPAPKLLKNSAGLVMGNTAWGDKALGIYYDRDWKFIRYGGELTKNTYAIAGRQGWEIRGKIGINF